jgi:hypothetical protein
MISQITTEENTPTNIEVKDLWQESRETNLYREEWGTWPETPDMGLRALPSSSSPSAWTGGCRDDLTSGRGQGVQVLQSWVMGNGGKLPVSASMLAQPKIPKQFTLL